MRSELGRKLKADSNAQNVFHQALLSHLGRYGASTSDAIADRGLSLFHLRLEHGEIQEVLELARQQRLVEPISDCCNGYGEAIGHTEWAPSQRGRGLKPVRGLTFAAIRDSLMEATPAGPKVAAVVQAVLVILVFAGVFKTIEGTSSGGGATIVYVAVGVFFLGFMFYRGVSGDAKLRRAARAWKRLQDTWPKYGRWKGSALRPWLAISAAFLILVPIAVGALGKGSLLLLVPYLSGIVIWGGLTFVRHDCKLERTREKQSGGAELPTANTSQLGG